jgi:hypothetical protein
MVPMARHKKSRKANPMKVASVKTQEQNKRVDHSFMAKVSVLAATAIMAMSTPAGAEIIYQDSFTGTNGTLLEEHTPNIHPAGTSWLSNGWTLEGDKATYSGAAGGATLPFVPVSGTVYTLSVDLTIPAGTTTQWAAFGFSSSSLAYDPIARGYAWGLQRDNGEVYTAAGLGTTGISSLLETETPGGTYTYSVTLDTRDTNWNVTWRIGTDILGTHTYISGNPDIQGIGLYDGGVNATYDNLTLSSIPEPAALTLAALACCLLGRQRRSGRLTPA